MTADRTFVTELATGLGMVGGADVASTIEARPPALANLGPDGWTRLEALWSSGAFAIDFEHGFANGHAFLEAPDALNGRPPRIVEWTGPRKAPGDEVVPADLRVDHVYLVSCKYRSNLLHNASPARLVDGLLAQSATDERGDWFHAVAPAEHQALYASCLPSLDPSIGWPAAACDLDKARRRELTAALRPWPADATDPYRRLCTAVSEATAARWSARITPRNREALLWRLLRIGSAPYFVLGTSPTGPMRLRIDTPWDWRQRYSLRSFKVVAQAGGQPRVAWRGRYRDRAAGDERTVEGHVELRWSHGRFSGPPEAKVYLDTPHDRVPGYHLLDPGPVDGAPGAADSTPAQRAEGEAAGALAAAPAGELTLFDT